MKRPLLTFALPFGLGIFAAQYLLPHQWQIPAVIMFALLGAAAAWIVRAKRAFALVITLGFALGIAWMGCYEALFLAPMEELRGKEIAVTLELVDYPEQTDYVARCLVRAEGISGKVMYYGDATLLALAPGYSFYG